jgi:hypothetical protein
MMTSRLNEMVSKNFPAWPDCYGNPMRPLCKVGGCSFVKTFWEGVAYVKVKELDIIFPVKVMECDFRLDTLPSSLGFVRALLSNYLSKLLHLILPVLVPFQFHAPTPASLDQSH